MHISDAHVADWRGHGYTVVERFLPESSLNECRAAFDATFPSWETYASAPLAYRTDASGGHWREIPYLGDALNLVALHPDLIDFVERALGTRDVVLTQSMLWAKYAGFDDFDQSLHVDYMNNSVLYPAPREMPDQCTVMVYYADVHDDLGPTYVIPRDRTAQEPLVPYLRPRGRYPDLYALERPLIVPAGSMLLYDLRTFHRGSRLVRPRGVRLTHHIAYRRADAPWVGYKVWANYGLTLEMQELIERASPRQREVLGIPAPGHPYWTEDTLAGNAARFPGMDMTPYLDAAHVGPEIVERERARMRKVPRLQDTTENTGVASVAGYLREGIRDLRKHSPAEADYWEAVLNASEASTSAASSADARLPAAAPLMLNLGCGPSVLPGFVNVDLHPGPNVQVADLRQPWPWPDSSVAYLYASHIIEHLPDKIFTMNELWRVLQPGATALIHVPTTEGPGAWQDPTHVSFWNRRSFLYFEAGSPYREGFAERYGIRARLRTVWMSITPTPDGPQLSILLQAVKP